jgi:hypothetical protein
MTRHAEELSRGPRKRGLGGAVQHGAPECGRLERRRREIHLATNLQNMVYDHPSSARAQGRDTADPREREGREESSDTDGSLYKARKKAIGRSRPDESAGEVRQPGRA